MASKLKKTRGWKNEGRWREIIDCRCGSFHTRKMEWVSNESSPFMTLVVWVTKLFHCGEQSVNHKRKCTAVYLRRDELIISGVNEIQSFGKNTRGGRKSWHRHGSPSRRHCGWLLLLRWYGGCQSRQDQSHSVHIYVRVKESLKCSIVRVLVGDQSMKTEVRWGSR